MLGSSTRNIANDEGDGPSEKGYSSSSAKEKSTKIHLEFEFLDFLVASTFLFCDWIDFVSCFEFDCGDGCGVGRLR